jgi:hypothetical protein
MIEASTPLIAIDYTFNIFDDLFSNIESMLTRVEYDINNASKANKDKCQLAVYASATEQLHRFASKANSERQRLKKSFYEKVASYKHKMELLNQLTDAKTSQSH